MDGTANFAAGVPLFGCMAAAVSKGEVVAGWIHDPLGDDTAIALRGEGAWIADGEGRHMADLRVAAPVAVERMVAAVSWTYLPEPLRGRVASRLPRLAGVVGFRCAAHEYRLTASGHAHAQLYNRLMPWDHLPGWLLHREAGGYSARFDGSDYRPTHRDGGLICAPDRGFVGRAAGRAARPVSERRRRGRRHPARPAPRHPLLHDPRRRRRAARGDPRPVGG